MNKTKTRLLAVLFVVFAVVVVFWGSNRGASAESNMVMRAVIEPSLTLSVSSNSPVLNIEPTASGQFGSSGFTVSTYTNNSTGYTLTMSVPDLPNLVSDTDVTRFVGILGDGTFTSSNFTTNRWGMSINGGEFADGGNYHKILVGDTLLVNESGPTGNTSEEVSINYAAKLDLLVAPGTYSTTLNFVALAKPSILYMQDVGTWGGSLGIGDEIQVKDNRDEKIYYVARLADGNIWMTQNLDHDIVSTPNFYTYYNTDIGHGSTPDTSATWTGVAPYTDDNDGWWDGIHGPESYDPGDLCWNGVISSTDQSGVTCTDRHYHLGNYYNWTAMVAMDDTTSYATDGVDVNQSICPAGWMLPKATGVGSFATLISGPPTLTGGANGSIHLAPNYFVYGGATWGELYGIGTDGYYLTSVVGGSKNVYLLYMSYWGNPTYLGMQNLNYRTDGYPMRCLVRPSS